MADPKSDPRDWAYEDEFGPRERLYGTPLAVHRCKHCGALVATSNLGDFDDRERHSQWHKDNTLLPRATVIDR